MGEEKKEEVKEEEEEKKEGETNKEERNEEEKKEEKNKEDERSQEIVLKVDMHCEACARKVARALKGFQGVEDVSADCKASKVVVKGRSADPLKVCERIKKKSGRKVELISPIPKPPEKEVKEDHKKEDPKQDKKDEQPPPLITVVLKVRMHCEACAQVLQKRIHKIQGVESVTTDIGNDEVIVKGVVDPEKLVRDVYRKTGKQASLVKEQEEEKKEEEKKEEAKKDDKVEEKKEGEEGKAEEEKKIEMKKAEYWPSKDYMEYAYPTQIFSDENPNACSVM